MSLSLSRPSASTVRLCASRPTRRTRATSSSRIVRVRAADASYADIETTLDAVRRLPPSERPEALERATSTVRSSLSSLKTTGNTNVWDSYPELMRRNVFPNELRQLGVQNPESIGRPSDANDFNFIVGVTMSTSLLATVVGVTLPGDWGAFGSYLIGGIALAVLAVGSTAPGLLRVAIDRFARVNPEYRRRIARHEAGHFLVGYALGVPVGSYDLGIDQSHVNFMESKLERKIFQGARLTEAEALPLAVVSMAGVAAEALEFEEVMGQTADLFDLQRMLNRIEPKMSDASQQQLTRWAVWQAASILKKHAGAFDALTEKMERGESVVECLKAIENAR